MVSTFPAQKKKTHNVIKNLSNRLHMFRDEFFINIVILLEEFLIWVSRYLIAEVFNVFYTPRKLVSHWKVTEVDEALVDT